MRFTAAVPWHQREKVPLNSILFVPVLLMMHPTAARTLQSIIESQPVGTDEATQYRRRPERGPLHMYDFHIAVY